MKKLSIEEKAKAYDEAIKYAQYLINERCKENTDGSFHRADLNKMFSELAESEDEKIRKAIIRHFQTGTHYISFYGVSKNKILSWLEKQGRQQNVNIQINPSEYINDMGGNGCYLKNTTLNPTDKVEPKFHEGDWIITNKNHIWYVDETPETTSYLYRLINQYGKVEVAEFEIVDKKARLWTIQDAKDGDVLACESGWTCIFKALDNHTNTFSSYCFMDSDKWFCNTGSECHTLDKAFIKAYNGEIRPATKEQRDTLMKAIADAGYTFNFDKKELRKLKFRVGDIVKSKSQPMLNARKIISIDKDCYWCEDRGCIGFAWEGDCELVKQNPAWSEEDEENLKWFEKFFRAESVIAEGKDIPQYRYLWLKSLRPQNWTKKDRERYISCLQRLSTGNPEQPETINSKWFKEHVYPQSTWKPSDEQMGALANACDGNILNLDYLNSLYQDLKKLKG